MLFQPAIEIGISLTVKHAGVDQLIFHFMASAPEIGLHQIGVRVGGCGYL
jgi:hypothetical protein